MSTEARNNGRRLLPHIHAKNLQHFIAGESKLVWLNSDTALSREDMQEELKRRKELDR